MILYKYVPYEAGKQILAGNSIGFACASDFNDPFELTGYPREEATNPVAQLVADVRSDAKRGIWLRNSAILSLTRSSLNPLMWAHYADAHRGFVLGLNVAVAGFASLETNLVPAQFGSVVYTEEMPKHDLLTRAVIQTGGEFSYRPEILEKLQRIFLHKPLCWSYEEEVRVVKCIQGIEKNKQLPSGTFTIHPLGTRQLYLLPFVDHAIAEVYLGVRTPIRTQAEFEDFASKVHVHHPQARLRRCVVGERTWTLESR